MALNPLPSSVQTVPEAALPRPTRFALGLGSVTDLITESVMITDPAGRILYVNPAFTKMTGYAPSEVMGNTPAMLKSGFQDREFYARMWSTILSGNVWRSEIINRRKDGTTYAEEMTITPVLGDDGRIACFVSVKQDVTRRQEGEAAQQLLASLVESSSDAIVAFDLSGRIQSWNRAAERMVGWTAEQAIGRMAEEFAVPERREVFRGILAGLLESQSGIHYESVILTASGQVLEVAETISPIRGPDGRITSFSAIVRDISERRRVERSRELLANIVESSADAMFTTDLNGTILSWNAGAEHVYGFPASEAVGRNVAMMATSHVMPECCGLLARIAMGERIHVPETTRRRRDGRSVDIALSLSPIRNENGAVVAMASIARDITSELRARRLIRESEDRFRAAFAHSPTGLCLTTTDGRFLQVNAALCRMLGYTEFELLGMSWRDVTYPADRRIEETLAEDLMTGRTPFAVSEKRCIRRDGMLVWVRENVSVMPDGPVQQPCLLAHVEDVTEHRRALERLRLSEERFRRLVDNLPDVMWTSDANGHLVYLSASAETVLGVVAGDRSDDGTPWFGHVHADDVARVKDGYHLLFREGQPFDEEYRVQRTDGVWIWVHARALRTYVENGVLYADGVLSDVTTRRSAEAESERARQAAEAANRAKSEFLANVSHELRTPLNGIIGMTALALQTATSDEQVDYLRTARHAAELLLKLINDILEGSKIEAGKLELSRTEFALALVLEESLGSLRITAEQKGLSFQTSIEPGTPTTLVGDPLRLGQVLLNLVGNAVKFTEQGGITITVGAVRRSDGQVTLRVRVSDTGIGVSPDKRNVIFEAFTQADGSTARRYGGTGLGLTISRKLSELMGGSLVLAESSKAGSTFEMTGVFGVPPTAKAAVLPSIPPGLRVLVAEDNPINQKLAQRLLARQQFIVELAADGLEALDRISTTTFDLILMDMQMPRCDGLDATLAIRRREQATGGHLPIVAMTARTLEGDREACLEAGMDGYVSKPVQFDELFSEIARVLHLVPPR